MSRLTDIMIEKYALLQLKYDFMGYFFDSRHELSFHHLIVPKRLCSQNGYGTGMYEWNGAILVRDTAHQYLHLIETINREMFEDITEEMIDQNRKGYLDLDNIRRIDDILCYFEEKYDYLDNKEGEPLIKDEYRVRVFNPYGE